VNGFQGSNVFTSIPRRHSHMKFSDGSRNNYVISVYVGPIQLPTPLCFQLTLRIYAAKNGLGAGAQTDFVLGRGKPEVGHWSR